MNNNIPTNKILAVYPEVMFHLYNYNVKNIDYICNTNIH